MTWIRTVPESEAQGALARVYAGARSRAGSVASIVEAGSLRAEGLRCEMALYQTVLFGPSELTRAEREAMAVTVSAANGCGY